MKIYYSFDRKENVEDSSMRTPKTYLFRSWYRDKIKKMVVNVYGSLPIFYLLVLIVSLVYYTTSIPKGDRANFAKRKCIFPHGMPMMVMQSSRP